jgi:HEAT repeats/PBS lyase HEAT-like repeat
MRTNLNPNRRLAGGVPALLLLVGLLLVTPGAEGRPKCKCVQGNACWHYLRATSSPPEDPCSCEFCEDVSRHDGTTPWPRAWNASCGANQTLGGLLLRHADSWNLSCSERNKPLKGTCKHPERHPRCGPKGSDWNRDGQEMMARKVEDERKVLGFKPVVIQSPHFYLVTDIPSLKLRTQAGNFRYVRTHELAHIYIERCEKAYEEFSRIFGRPTMGRPSGIFLFKSKSVASMVQARYLGSARSNLLYGGGGTSISNGHCFNGFVVNTQEHSGDRSLHATVRHLLGHLFVSCWVCVNGTDKYLPKWMFVGAAHWLSKSHPKLRDEGTFCGNESAALSASHRNWDNKAKKLAASGNRAPIQALFDAHTTKEMNQFDMHLRAWSFFDVYLKDDPERFVAFLKGLRELKPARQSMRSAMKCEPEEFDRRWADRLLGRRRSAGPTVAELDNADPTSAGARDRRAIRQAVEPKRIASLVRGLDVIRDVKTARTVFPLLGHPNTHVREVTVLTLGKTREKKILDLMRTDGLKKTDGLALANMVRVLGICKDAESSPALLELLGHGNWLVRANACRSLAQMQVQQAVDPLIKRVARDASPKVTIAAMQALAQFEEEAGRAAGVISPELGTSSWQIRVAAAKTLGRLGQMSAVEDLITRMENEAGRVREECLDALKKITRDDLGKKPKFWRDWWEKEKERARGVPKRPEKPPEPKHLDGRDTVAKDEPTYYGIKVFSQSLGYVLDISQSMESRFIVSPAVEAKLGRTFQAHTKIGIAKEELIHSIQALDPRATFNVILFNSNVRAWKNAPVPATASNKGRGISLIRNTRPTLETNYYDTFLEVFGLKQDELPGARFRRTPDTVFFLTDGRPTVGDITSTDELLQWFREENRFAQLRCHVIAFGTKGVDIHFLSTLAKENSGTFFHLTGE